MNNVAPDYDMPTDKYGKPIALRNAVNVDVGDSGKVRRRNGFTPVANVSGAHSLWRGDGEAFVVVGGALMRFNGAATIAVGNVPGITAPVAYVQAGAHTYFTCPTASGRVSAGVLSPWGVEVPNLPPMISPTAGGFDAGIYSAAMTYLLADGRESGASQLASVTLNASGGFAVMSMPVPTSAAITKKRLYLSSTNGDTLYLAGEFSPDALFAVIGSPVAGVELRTEFLSAPPFGTALAYYNDRIFIARGKVVEFTEASDYDHVDRRKNYYAFNSDVSLIAAATDGLYVCADKTYFIPSAVTSEAMQVAVLDFGAIANTAQDVPKSTNVIWMSPNGAVIAKAGGEVEVLADGNLVPGLMANAASLVREEDGLRQFVAVGTTVEASALRATSYAEAEIIRRAG